MTSFVLAWRTAMCYRARSALAMAGVAIIGALLFDMLLLSRGLVDSFADLLNTSGFDVRVVASEGLPMLRGPIHGAPALAGQLSGVPEVEAVTLVRIEEAVITGAPGSSDDLKNVTIVGMSHQGTRQAWTLLRGTDLPPAGTTSDRCPLIITRHLASLRHLEPGATVDLRIVVPGRPSALPKAACRVVGIADFAFATAGENAAAMTMEALEAADSTRSGDEADLVLVRSRNGGTAAARAIARVRPDLHVYSNEDVVAQFNQNGFAYFRQVSVVLSSVTLVFAFLLVGTLLTVSTNQRLGEIAALRALGIGRVRIAAMLLWESGVLVGSGGLLALPIGGLLAWQLDRLLRQMPGLPERLHFFVFNASAVAEHVLLLTATAIVAACYPIWLAARLPIAETLRREIVG
jgi:putative ABC transport system permease protein